LLSLLGFICELGGKGRVRKWKGRGISHLVWEKIVKEEGEKNAYD